MNPYVSNYAYSDCRLLGHLWHVVPSDWKATIGHPMTVRCERCNIERRDQIGSNTGEVVARKYQYPEGYLFHRENGTELPRRDDFRLAWLEHEVTKVRQHRKRK